MRAAWWAYPPAHDARNTAASVPGFHRFGSLGAHTQFGFRASFMIAGVIGGEYQRRKWYTDFNGRTENAFYFVLRIPFSKVGDAEGIGLPGRLLASFDC